MDLKLYEGEAGDPRNALFLAMACDFAYFDEAAASPLFREKLGLDAKLISVNNTQVYLAQNDEAVVLAFRGSQSPDSLDGLKDWLLTNANDLLILPEGQLGTDFAAAGVGARFHRGFLVALEEVWEPLFRAIDAAQKEKERPLWITGHSLGGALALMAAWRLQRKFVQVEQIYTFGAPMIGNAAAAQSFEKEFSDKIFRYVDEKDFVPHLPAFSLIANAYGHCLNEVLLGGKPVAEAAETISPTALEVLKQLAHGSTDELLKATLIDDLWRQTCGRIDRHMIANYHALIAAKIDHPA